MGIGVTLLYSVGLAMDASAVAMTNGMTYPKLSVRRALLIGLFFGIFQFLMPVVGYFITGIIKENFQSVFESAAAWVSFGLLAFLGGKMLYEGIEEWIESKNPSTDGCENCKTVGAGTRLTDDGEVQSLTLSKLLLQAIATSVDALAVGFTLQAMELGAGLALGVWGTTALIGIITFALSFGAVYIGKVVGMKLADKAEIFGGVVLLIIGLKILIG